MSDEEGHQDHLEVLGQLLQGGLHKDAQLLHDLLAVNLPQFFCRSLNFGQLCFVQHLTTTK